MSELGRIMAASLRVRHSLPAELVPVFDGISEKALRYAAAEDARQAVDAVESAMDSRPLAEVVELHPYSKGVA